MLIRLKNAWTRDETGAVTVDWVIMVALVLSLGYVVLSILGGTTQDHANELGGAMSSFGIVEYGGMSGN